MSQFTAQSRVTLDASGNGTLTFRPNSRTWQLRSVLMQCSTNADEALGSVYVGSLAETSKIAVSMAASTGDTATGDFTVTDGTPIYVVWTGGTPGAIATAVLSGEQTDPGRGFRARPE